MHSTEYGYRRGGADAPSDVGSVIFHGRWGIVKCYEYIPHYHAGGNPGRNEIDETQELYYPAIMRAIVETGYRGYVGQEFIPKGGPVRAMEQAFAICDV